MRNKRRKQVETQKRQRRTVFFTLGILVVICISFTLIFGENGLVRFIKLRAIKEDVRAKVNRIDKQNKEIKRQIDLVKKGKDLNLIEELAREQGLTQKDEIIFQYQDGQ
ncbi:MAG: septum formation initiator family protein [Thermodesulfovibrionia bacterium]|nr:septum formation initiator family protein [Thermodesulfovibrionia bacterium]MCK5512133.1 septum formation initiator family protein [Thermodesulfovibrionia bacterium]